MNKQAVHHFFVVNKNVIAGWGARIIVLFLALVNTRLLVDCVGTDGLAAYSIVVSLSPWLALLNLGLPITVQNSISRFRGEGDYIMIRDHSFGTLLIIVLVLSPVSIFIGWVVHKYFMVNYPFVSVSTVMAVCLLIFLMGVSQLFSQVMYAEHEAFWPNMYPAFAPIWTLLVLIIARHLNVKNFNVVLLLIGFSNLLMPIHAARHLRVFKRFQFSLQYVGRQLRESKDQLLFAIMATVTLSVDYLVMSRILDAQDIVQYTITNRLFMTLMLVHSVLLSTYWTPVSDLIHSSKKKEAEEKVAKVLRRGLLIGGGAGFLIFNGVDLMASILTNEKVSQIPFDLCLAFWIYVMLRIWTDTYAMAVQGAGFVSKINKFMPLQALISAVSQYLLGAELGALGIVLGLIISFVLTASWIIPRDFYRIIRS